MAKETKKVFEVSDLFMSTREREGVWYEPKIDDIGCGLEFKLLGPSSDENSIAAEVYSKKRDEIEKEKDVSKAAKLQRENVCRRIASIITDIRAANGAQIVLDGKPLEYSDEFVMQILDENIEIRTDLLNAAFESSTFMKKKN